MGALSDKIRTDMTDAMKAQDKEKLSTLRMLQSAVKNEQINLGHELSDEEAMAVIRKAVKQRQDSIEQYTTGNRPELAEKERSEMEVLKAYLPPELTDEELESGIREIIASTGAASKKDMGKVMKEATARYKGRVDGKKVQELVQRLLP
ncbi:MAG TPA: GatB/YqeY domain-containing protein [Thermoanaerobaculia bacterium]